MLAVAVNKKDDARAGKHWESDLGIKVCAALTPDEKMVHLQNTAGKVAMVGDGINDGPALASASVGLAMSKGTDVAHSAADVVLLRDTLRLIPWLFGLSRTAMSRVRENLIWAVFYNLIGVGLAMAGLLQPVFSAVAMVASSVFVTANSMRMRKYPLMEE